MKATALLVLLMFLFHPLIAQIDKENFRKMFDEEDVDPKYSSRENHSGKYQNIKPQQLPDWFTKPPIANKNEVFAIGISDPEMDSAAATEMAIYRAQIMANVLRKSTVQLLCDFFMNEQNQSVNIVFEHFSRINTFVPIKAHYTIVNTYRNSFDETMVLIKYKIPKRPEKNDLRTVKLELYKNEIESTAYGDFESIYELQVKSDLITNPDPVFYQLTELGPRSDVVSATQSVDKQIPIYMLPYLSRGLTDTVEYSYFSHGLWKEYIKSVMIHIINVAREKPENITNMTETHNTNSVVKLTRGISVNKMRFAITGIETKDNFLNVYMQQLPVE